MCGDAPEPDPLLGEAARMNAETAKEALSFYKTIYDSDIRPMQQRDMTMREGLVQNMRGIMNRQQEIAEEQYGTYKDTYLPAEKRAVEDAMSYDSQQNIDRRAGIAGANVVQQFSNAQNQNARSLTRLGLNPNSSAFARANASLMNQQALGAAGAQTGAAFDTMDRGIALRAAAADRGRGVVGTTGNFLNSATGSGQATSGVSSQGFNNVATGAGIMGQGFNTSIAGNQSAGNLMAQDFQGRMQGYSADQAAIGGLFSGLGSMAGMALGPGFLAGGAGGMAGKTAKAFADGGAIRAANGGQVGRRGIVRGPGNGVSDSVSAVNEDTGQPYRLSNGEYIVPADVVEAKGREFFDKLLDRYHTPAEIQRMGISSQEVA